MWLSRYRDVPLGAGGVRGVLVERSRLMWVAGSAGGRRRWVIRQPSCRAWVVLRWHIRAVSPGAALEMPAHGAHRVRGSVLLRSRGQRAGQLAVETARSAPDPRSPALDRAIHPAMDSWGPSQRPRDRVRARTSARPCPWIAPRPRTAVGSGPPPEGRRQAAWSVAIPLGSRLICSREATEEF